MTNHASICKWIAKHRLALIAPLPVFAVVCCRGEWENDFAVWTMGPLCVLAGVFLRVWAQQHIQRRLGLPGHLTTTGPYAHMRNPLYVGNTLIVLGAVVMSELAWLVPVTLLWCLGIFSIAACYEESRLVEKYGDVYREYARDVPRWLPRITGWRRPDISGHLLLPALRAEIASVMIVVPYLLKEVILS